MNPREMESVDDLDPLAPVMYDADEPPAPDDADEWVDEADGGFSDADNIVRVWVEDGRLAKVRVSPVWFSRLGRRSLADCFAQAFRFANLTVATDVPERVEPTFDDQFDFSTIPPLTAHAFGVMQELFADVEVRWDEAIARHDAREAVAGTPTLGRSKGVSVVLNDAGLADAVEFDDKWLDDAQAGTICTHVQLAAADAYRRFVPSEDDRHELTAIEEEHQFLTATLNAMLNPEERR